MQERRKFVRVDAPVLVEFTEPGKNQVERSFTHDVSEVGMRFPTTVKFKIGQEIPFMLGLPMEQPMMKTLGHVIWIREVSSFTRFEQYEVGVRFSWVHDPDRQRLVKHLNALLGE